MPAVQTEALIESLARPWTANVRDQALDLAQRFAQGLGVGPKQVTSGVHHFTFTIDLSSLYLRGTAGPVPVLLVGGDADAAIQVVERFWQEHGNGDELPVFLFASSAAWHVCRAKIPQGRRVVLSPAMLRRIIESQSPSDEFQQLIRDQVSRLLLSPFNITKPAIGNMFFGRQRELARLLEDDGQSYVVAGPSRIGKSSLLLRYKAELTLRHDPRAQRLYFVSFYDCPSHDPDVVAQHLAFRIDETKKGYEMTADRLVRYLKWRRQFDQGPLELLLDEIDDVCGSRAFQYLAQSAKDGDVRVVLCGRSAALLKLEFGGNSNAGLRLQTLRPEPLDESAAMELIRKPMRGLGIVLENEQVVLEHVLRMTGRFPHLLQFYGKHLVERAADSNKGSVGMSDIEAIEASFETVNFFVAPLHELRDARAKEIAKVVLRINPAYSFSCRDVVTYMRSSPIPLSVDEVFDLCNLLVMQNVLSWRGDGFQIASAGLRHFSRKAGLLES
jgi:hypothetical protein